MMEMKVELRKPMPTQTPSSKKPNSNYSSCDNWGNSLIQELMTQFYSVVIESTLCSSITVWFRAEQQTSTHGQVCGKNHKNSSACYWGTVQKINSSCEQKTLSKPQPTQTPVSSKSSPQANATDPFKQTVPDTQTASILPCHRPK